MFCQICSNGRSNYSRKKGHSSYSIGPNNGNSGLNLMNSDGISEDNKANKITSTVCHAETNGPLRPP